MKRRRRWTSRRNGRRKEEEKGAMTKFLDTKEDNKDTVTSSGKS